jgi:hypothetical protein
MDSDTGSILQILSRESSFEIFDVIATKGNVKGRTLLTMEGISEKKYYTTTEKLVKHGLVKRRHTVFTPTSLGRVVYHNLSKIDAAIKVHSTLKAIDSIKGPKVERDRASKILIDGNIKNSYIKRILLRDVH